MTTIRTAPYESFEEWHGDEPDDCPLCNPHICDDHCHNCEEPK